MTDVIISDTDQSVVSVDSPNSVVAVDAVAVSNVESVEQHIVAVTDSSTGLSMVEVVETTVTVVSEQGPPGAPGEKGEAGAPGGSTYVHNQLAPEAVWVIQHNMGRYCSVTVLDSAGSTVVGDVRFDSVNQVTITFSAAFAGVAQCI